MNSFQWDLLTQNWALVAAAGIGVVGWIVVTLINRAADNACHHHWENVGNVVRKSELGMLVAIFQPVRCSKCGELRSFTLASSED